MWIELIWLRIRVRSDMKHLDKETGGIYRSEDRLSASEENPEIMRPVYLHKRAVYPTNADCHCSQSWWFFYTCARNLNFVKKMALLESADMSEALGLRNFACCLHL
jgi:hypothetical protein